METCFNFSMRKANRVLNKIYDGHLQACDLKGGQYTILRVIHEVRETTNRQLQDILLIDQTTLSRNLKPLIRDGYIEVSPAEDQRVKLLSLSSSGKKLFVRASKHWQQAQEDVKQRLGLDSTKKLLEMSKLVANLKT